ncbi:hypothetical protein CR513_59240, partial [Mucuna pruriens]
MNYLRWRIMRLLIRCLNNSKGFKDNYDYDYNTINNQRSLAFHGSKDLKNLAIEKYLYTLKVHKIELKEDKRKKKGKSIVLKVPKDPRGSLSKVLKVEESFDEGSKE